MDAWDVSRARDNPCDPRFYGSFVYEFGETLDDDMKRLKEIYQKSQANPKDWLQVLDDFIVAWNGQSHPLRVGVEGQHLPSMARDVLMNKQPKISFKNVDETLRRIRMIKTPMKLTNQAVVSNQHQRVQSRS